jgi:hypothetical protein
MLSIKGPSFARRRPPLSSLPTVRFEPGTTENTLNRTASGKPKCSGAVWRVWQMSGASGGIGARNHESSRFLPGGRQHNARPCERGLLNSASAWLRLVDTALERSPPTFSSLWMRLWPQRCGQQEPAVREKTSPICCNGHLCPV